MCFSNKREIQVSGDSTEGIEPHVQCYLVILLQNKRQKSETKEAKTGKEKNKQAKEGAPEARKE